MYAPLIVPGERWHAKSTAHEQAEDVECGEYDAREDGWAVGRAWWRVSVVGRVVRVNYMSGMSQL